MPRRLLLSLVAGTLAIGLAATGLGPLNVEVRAGPLGPIEAVYAQRGPWVVARSEVVEGGTKTYDLIYPRDLGAGGRRHPIITFGNGSIATAKDYPGLLDHLASWGWVVIDSVSEQAGTGQEILHGAQLMVAADADATSRFHATLDTTRIAALGHSQGAGGSVRAATRSQGLITTVVVNALPNRLFVTPLKDNEYEPSQLAQPIFFTAGTEDGIANGVIDDFYGEVDGAAAMGLLAGADHNTIQKTGGGYLGYVTAWLAYQLDGDARAAEAFLGDEFRTSASWRQQATKGLPPATPPSPRPASTPAPASTLPRTE